MKYLCVLLLSSFLFVGCGYTRHYAHVEKFEMETLAAPEIRGAGGYKEPNTANVRMSANVHVGSQDKEQLRGLRNKMDGCNDITQCKAYKSEEVNETVDGTYKMKYPYVEASLDYISKKELFLWGISFALDKGVYGSFLLGVNTKYFEVGGSLGMWMHFRDFDYSGTTYSCDPFYGAGGSFDKSSFERGNGVGVVVTYGGYASAYYGPLSLNFSVNIYRPDPEYPADDDGSASKSGRTISEFDFPLVVTEYITAGYRINENWEVRLGASNIVGEFPGWHWGATGGISYYTK